MNSITRNIAAITGSIFAIGTGCARLIAVSASSRRRRHARLMVPVAALLTIGAGLPPSAAELEVAVSGLRNQHGAVMICLTRRAGRDFLACDRDPDRVTRMVAAGEAGLIHLAGLVPGDYSLLLLHDENRNGKLDTRFGMPREGFGFSRNPALRIGPPHYADVHFPLPAGHSHQAIKVKYLL